jgi:hypothetical protein
MVCHWWVFLEAIPFNPPFLGSRIVRERIPPVPAQAPLASQPGGYVWLFVVHMPEIAMNRAPQWQLWSGGPPVEAPSLPAGECSSAATTINGAFPYFSQKKTPIAGLGRGRFVHIKVSVARKCSLRLSFSPIHSGMFTQLLLAQWLRGNRRPTTRNPRLSTCGAAWLDSLNPFPFTPPLSLPV